MNFTGQISLFLWFCSCCVLRHRDYKSSLVFKSTPPGAEPSLFHLCNARRTVVTTLTELTGNATKYSQIYATSLPIWDPNRDSDSFNESIFPPPVEMAYPDDAYIKADMMIEYSVLDPFILVLLSEELMLRVAARLMRGFEYDMCFVNMPGVWWEWQHEEMVLNDWRSMKHQFFDLAFMARFHPSSLTAHEKSYVQGFHENYMRWRGITHVPGEFP